MAGGVEAAIAIVHSGIAIARCEFLDAQCIKNVNAHHGLNLEEASRYSLNFMEVHVVAGNFSRFHHY